MCSESRKTLEGRHSCSVSKYLMERLEREICLRKDRSGLGVATRSDFEFLGFCLWGVYCWPGLMLRPPLYRGDDWLDKQTASILLKIEGYPLFLVVFVWKPRMWWWQIQKLSWNTGEVMMPLRTRAEIRLVDKRRRTKLGLDSKISSFLTMKSF